MDSPLGHVRGRIAAMLVGLGRTELNAVEALIRGFRVDREPTGPVTLPHPVRVAEVDPFDPPTVELEVRLDADGEFNLDGGDWDDRTGPGEAEALYQALHGVG